MPGPLPRPCRCRDLVEPAPVVHIVAPTRQMAAVEARRRRLPIWEWRWVDHPLHLRGVSHVVLVELPDGRRGDDLWHSILLLKHTTFTTVEGVIG